MAGDVWRENVTVVTGASSGIGRAVALRLAEQGAWLVLASPETDDLAHVAAACRERGGRAIAVTTDVADETRCEVLIDRAVAEFGRLDTLINNAGVGFIARLHELPDLRTFERVMRINFLGSVYCAYHALPHLKAAHGRLVGVSSIMGKFAAPRNTAYCASKHSLAGFYDALRSEVRKTVSVTVIYPNLVASSFPERLLESDGRPRGERGKRLIHPRMMTADTCARHILVAAARRRRERVLTFQGRLSLWLKLLIPSLLDAGTRKTLRTWK